MNNIKLILPNQTHISSDKINSLFEDLNQLTPEVPELKPFTYLDNIKKLTSRMNSFISKTEAIFEVSDDIIYSFGDIYPAGEFEVMLDNVDSVINHFLDDPFFINSSTNIFGSYPLPLWTHDHSKYKFHAEGIKPFEVYVKINEILPLGLYYVIDTGTAFKPSINNDIKVNSFKYKSYIRQYTSVDTVTNIVKDCSEPFAYVSLNKVIPDNFLIINQSSGIIEKELEKLTIKNIFIGRNITRFPYTLEIENPNINLEVKLALSTVIEDAKINVTYEYTKPGNKIIIEFENESSMIRGLKLRFKR